MDVWEVLRVVGSYAGGLAAVALAIIGYLYKQQTADMKASINNEAQERKLEFASLRGRMETLGDERENGDATVHNRINDLERRLPQEYARQGSIDSIERRIGNIESEMKDGFRHTDTQLQELLRMLKRIP